MIPNPEAAAWAAEVADDFAATMHGRDPDLGLDGTPPSLFRLDDMVAGAGRIENWEQLVMPATAAYFGEVVVRAGGGVWVVDEEGRSFVQTRTGFLLDPFASVRERGYDEEGWSLDDVFAHAMAGAPVPTDETLATGLRFGPDLQLGQWSWATLHVAEQAVRGIRLGWDAASLEVADRLCGDIAAQGPVSDDALGAAQLRVGAYLGEVIRGEVGGTWVHEAGAIGLRVSPQVVCFPLDKVAKRIENGPGDDLVTFHMVTVRGARGELPGM